MCSPFILLEELCWGSKFFNRIVAPGFYYMTCLFQFLSFIMFSENCQRGFFCGILWKVFIRHFSAVPAVVLFIFLVAHLSVIVLLSQVTAPTFEQMLLIWLHIYISSLNVLFSFFKADTADETAWSFFFKQLLERFVRKQAKRQRTHLTDWGGAKHINKHLHSPH